jgi:hypothetical protein
MLGANPYRIGDRLVWAVRSNDLAHWATQALQKTGRHDIAEILLKVTLNTKIQIQIPHKTSLTQPFLL